MPCINCVLFSLLLQPPISDGYWPELACRSWWWFWYIYTLLPQLSIWLVWWVCMMGKISLHPHLLLGLWRGKRSSDQITQTRILFIFPFPTLLRLLFGPWTFLVGRFREQVSGFNLSVKAQVVLCKIYMRFFTPFKKVAGIRTYGRGETLVCGMPFC